jgi:5-formyltetrahydrofolate cyclo-ligase
MSRKEEMRAKALTARKAIPRREVEAASRLVEANLRSLEEYKGARLILSYCAKPDEVQTRSIIESALREGKRVAVPTAEPATRGLAFSEITSMEEVGPGHYGIPEPKPEFLRPVPLREADLALVPLVAWDLRGRRLGHGQGYFDRALAGQRLTKVGLAFESQRVERVPESRHDVPLDVIVTEKRTVRAGRERFVLNRKGRGALQ